MHDRAPRYRLTPPEVILQDLEQIVAFQLLPRTQVLTLVPLARRHDYDRGMLLLTEDDTLSMVIRGRIRTVMVAQTGQLLTLTMHHRGDIIAHVPHQQAGATPIHAEAAAPGTVVYCLPWFRVLHVLSSHPASAAQALDLVRGHLTEAHQRLTEMAWHAVRIRLAHRLAELAQQSPQQLVEETHADLAGWVGASREQVTKELRYLQHLGLITVPSHRRHIVVHRLDALANFEQIAPNVSNDTSLDPLRRV